MKPFQGFIVAPLDMEIPSLVAKTLGFRPFSLPSPELKLLNQVGDRQSVKVLYRNTDVSQVEVITSFALDYYG